MVEQEMQKIRVIVKSVPKTDKHEAFSAYYIVGDGGRLVDLRFCRSVNTAIFAGLEKFEIDAVVDDASARYEYPRMYCKAVNPESLVKIR